MSAPRVGDRVRVRELTGHVDSIAGAYAELTLEDAGKHDLANLPLHVLSVIHPSVKVGDVIETAEQLDALPVGSVVREVAHRVPADICPDVCERWASGWYSTGTASDVRPALPTAVLYLPDGAA